MPQYTDSQRLSREGENFVEAVALHAGWISRPLDKDDVGIDMLLERTEAGRPMGDLVALQVKSGPSYWSKKRSRCRVPLKRKTKDWASYWQQYCVPVVLVVYDEIARRAAWFDVHRHFLGNSKADSWGSISFRPENWLTSESIRNEFPALVARMQKPGLPGMPAYVAKRANLVLDECLQMIADLQFIGYDPMEDGGHSARQALRHIYLPFDGQITCMNSGGVCTLHNDERLIGEDISKFQDISDHYVFSPILGQTRGSVQWIDDFDADRFQATADVVDYLQASTQQPTRANTAAFAFFEPWDWYVIVEAHSKIWRT